MRYSKLFAKAFESGGSKASTYRLTEDEINAMISLSDGIRDRLVLEILAFSGCRRGELVLIRRVDVDLNKGIIQMPTLKRRRGDPYENSRTVPILNDRLKNDLESYIEITELKFHPTQYSKLIQGKQNRDVDGINKVRINQIVAESAERAGVKSPNPHRKHVHPHMFRHNFVRYARWYGLDFKVISEIIGHESISTTFDMYGSPDTEEIIEQAKKMSSYGDIREIYRKKKFEEHVNRMGR